MKKVFFIAVAALAFVACNNNKTNEAAAEATEAATEVVEEVKADAEAADG